MRAPSSGLLFTALAGCSSGAAPPPLAAPPAIEIAGCDELQGEPITCLLREPRLTVWVPRPADAAIHIADGSAPAHVLDGPLDVAGGSRWVVEVRSSRLEVRVAGHLPVVVLTATVAPDDAIEAVARLRREGALGPARAAAERLGARPGALAQRARNALAAGAMTDALALFAQAQGEARAARRWWALIQDQIAEAYVWATIVRQPERASLALTAIPELPPLFAEVRAEAAFARASLAYELRDVRGAQEAAHLIEDSAARLGLVQLEVDLLQMLIALETFARRWPQVDVAMERLRAALAHETDPCKSAELATNISWHALVRRSHATTGDWPTAELDRAIALYDDGCRDDRARLNAEVNRAWLAYFTEPVAAARQRFARLRLRSADVPSQERDFLLQLEGAVQLAEKDWIAAERSFAALERRGRASLSPALVMEALAGRARALEARGRGAAALQLHREIDSTLDDVLSRIPWGRGKASFLFDQQRLTERYLAALVERGLLAEAESVIRRSNARALGDLAPGLRWSAARQEGGLSWETAAGAVAKAREALDTQLDQQWRTLPAERTAQREREQRARTALQSAVDALLVLTSTPARASFPPLAATAHEPALLVHPAGDRWLLLRSDGRARAARAITSSATAEQLDAAVDALIGGHAVAVRLFVHPDAEGAEWHARGRGRRPMTYVVDWSRSRAATSSVALVLGDLAETLPSARSEAAAVAEQLRGHSWQVRAPAAATAATLRAALDPPPLLFHYSGHGHSRGADGLDELIPASDGEGLSTSDILALTQAPREVVLAACGLGKRRSDDTPGGLSLAHAFLLRGADVVVTAPRDIPDDTARILIPELYRARLGGASWAQALRAAADTARSAGAADPDVLRLVARR